MGRSIAEEVGERIRAASNEELFLSYFKNLGDYTDEIQKLVRDEMNTRNMTADFVVETPASRGEPSVTTVPERKFGIALGGWLTFYLWTVILGQIFAVYRFAKFAMSSGYSNADLFYFATVFVLAVVSVSLIFRKNRNGKIVSIGFLVYCALIGIAQAITAWPMEIGELLYVFVRPVALSIVWSWYFAVSTRVSKTLTE